jgi:hypothetical protein
MVNQTSSKGSDNRKDSTAFFFLTDNCKLKTNNQLAATHSQSCPRILCPQLQESTS